MLLLHTGHRATLRQAEGHRRRLLRRPGRHIIVDHRFAFRLSPQPDSATSPPLLSSGLTVYAGIVRAQLPAGSQVAVLGAGGLGHLAIQFLYTMGHSVIGQPREGCSSGWEERSPTARTRGSWRSTRGHSISSSRRYMSPSTSTHLCECSHQTGSAVWWRRRWSSSR
jgi:hypothetical protein